MKYWVISHSSLTMVFTKEKAFDTYMEAQNYIIEQEKETDGETYFGCPPQWKIYQSDSETRIQELEAEIMALNCMQSEGGC